MLFFLFLLCFFSFSVSNVIIQPPNPLPVAPMARYIIHESDWVSIATISTLNTTKNYPFVNLKSMADGPVENGTGVPYLYMTKLDLSGQDVEKNNHITIMATLAQSDYCKKQSYDPQDPRCARTIISGKLIKITNETAEYAFAESALFGRHPEMKFWPKNHHFYLAKVQIEQILVLDQFGGVKYVSVKDYFSANLSTCNYVENFIEDDEISVINLYEKVKSIFL